MSESEEAIAHVPITISVDVDALLKSELGWTSQYSGNGPNDWEEEEPIPGGNGQIIDVVASKLAAAIKDSVKPVVLEAVKERAVARVDELIDEIMTTPITLTSGYGEPKSPEMTMREAMIKAMADRLDEKVDMDGKRKRDSYGTSQTYIQWRAEQVARSVMDKELSGRLADTVNQIRDKAKDLVSVKISQALGRVI